MQDGQEMPVTIQGDFGMKRTAMILAVVVLVAGAGLGLHAFAKPHRGGFGPDGMGFGGPGFMMKHMARKLQLTDEQQAQVKGIVRDGFNRAQPLIEQLRKNQDARDSAVNAQFDENAARSFANSQAQIIAELIVEKERAKAQIYNVLTPEQRQKAEAMRKERQQRMQDHIDAFKEQLQQPKK
jgi:Spy/CpxP family protein refolding chaperone